MNAARLIWFFFVLAAVAYGPVRAGDTPIPTDIGVTMTATPSSDLRTGQVIDIALTVTNFGPLPADNLVLSSSWYYNEFDVTYIDAVACYQFGGAIGEGEFHPIYVLFWFIAGIPNTGMQPLGVGETRTCHFQLTLREAAPAVTPFTFGVSGIFVDVNANNDSANVYLNRTIPSVPAVDGVGLALLVALVCVVGVVALHKSSNST